MDIYLVRHGEMDYEKSEGIDIELINSFATGEQEGPLTERGIEQAKLVARYLATKRLNALYSSKFVRTLQTGAETAKRLGLDVTVIPELGELNVGRLNPDVYPSQMRALKILKRLHDHLPRVMGERAATGLVGYFFIVFYFRSWYKKQTEGGETFSEAVKRIREALHSIAQGHDPGHRVAVFTHGYFIHLLINQVVDPLRAPIRLAKTPYIHNGAVTHITGTLGTGWRVLKYCSTKHLKQ